LSLFTPHTLSNFDFDLGDICEREEYDQPLYRENFSLNESDIEDLEEIEGMFSESALVEDEGTLERSHSVDVSEFSRRMSERGCYGEDEDEDEFVS